MRALHFIALFALILVSGCASTPKSSSYLAPTMGVYLLDSGDQVRLTVYGEEELSDEFRVDDSGQLSLPLVGSVHVRGLSTKQAADKIVGLLAAGFIRDPDVAVEVVQYRPFYIQGAVSASGQYPYVPGMTVRGAVSTAGGYEPTANESYAILYRRTGEEIAKGKVALDFPVQPGDTVVIAERWL
ncbi:polysaccharide biosynthesis/export family protein [Cucumibacter marinus]|uniref:polysaccharide biosynthesis/export family protein n=1 Tax=Cucumibacter marinus TaxID=1121252 RepID=UPI0004065787|nr:polysaccharide biosynthesis/export family protein [Cucumibacter marinus]